MKKILLPLAVIFITISSFSSDKNVVAEEEVLIDFECLAYAVSESRSICSNRPSDCTSAVEEQISRQLYRGCLSAGIPGAPVDEIAPF